MQVPLLDLKAQFRAIEPQVRRAIDRVLEGQRFILGPEVKRLEEELAAYSHCRFGIGVSSGTDALLVALMAIDLKPGDEVITTPYTFFATGGAIARLGATPVFADIDPLTFNINPNQIKEVINDRTRAVIPVHLFGQVANMNPILKLATDHDLIVIEDAAQAIGAEYKGRRAGSMGHFGCFSFFPSKNLGGLGDGGMVTTNDERLEDKVRQLRDHGFAKRHRSATVGGNFRLDEIQAAVLRAKLSFLESWTDRRRANAAIYRRLLKESGLSLEPSDCRCLAQGCLRRQDCGLSRPTAGVILPDEAAGNRHIYNQFVIRIADRDRLQLHLEAKGVGCAVYYPLPLHLQVCFADLGCRVGDYPVSECAAETTLALPIYPELTALMIERVAEVMEQFCRQ